MMPARGGAARAEALATVVKLGFERFASDEVGALLDALGPWAAALPYESDEASLVRVTRREYDKARRVPAALKAEIARTAAIAGDAWIEARKASDFAAFRPHLERDHRAQARVRGLPRRAGDRSLRCTARRLRAGLHLGRGGADVRRAGGGIDAAARHRPVARGGRRRAPARRSLPGRPAARVLPHRAAQDRLRRRRVPARRLGPPVRDEDVRGRRPHDDALRREPAERRVLRLRPRAGPRALRERDRPGAGAHAARSRDLDGGPRIAEPALGERRRARAAVLAVRLPGAAAGLPGALRARPARGVLARDQQGRAVADPGRGRRGDLQPARAAALRAGAGADRGRPGGGRPPGGVERGDAEEPRHCGPRRPARRAAGHPLVAGGLRLLPDLHAGERDRGAALGDRRRPSCRGSRERSRTGSSRRSAAGCASGSTATARSSRGRSCWCASPGGPSTRRRTWHTCAGRSGRSTGGEAGDRAIPRRWAPAPPRHRARRRSRRRTWRTGKGRSGCVRGPGRLRRPTRRGPRRRGGSRTPSARATAAARGRGADRAPRRRHRAGDGSPRSAADRYASSIARQRARSRPRTSGPPDSRGRCPRSVGRSKRGHADPSRGRWAWITAVRSVMPASRISRGSRYSPYPGTASDARPGLLSRTT